MVNLLMNEISAKYCINLAGIWYFSGNIEK